MRYIPKLASLIGVDAQYLYLISKFVWSTNPDDIAQKCEKLSHT